MCTELVAVFRYIYFFKAGDVVSYTSLPLERWAKIFCDYSVFFQLIYTEEMEQRLKSVPSGVSRTCLMPVKRGP